MERLRFGVALASATLLIAAAGAASVSAQTTTSTSAPALDARYLRARRTATGYTLTGQALVTNACQAARFDQFLGNVFPPQFDLNQFRRPGTSGLLCAPHALWVTAMPKAVASTAPPHSVTVRTKKGFVRVPIL